VFLIHVINREKNTLLPIIKQFIKPGTTIISDCWSSYQCLNKEEYEHFTVNHSVTFKDPETGAHTNTIEGTWFHVKRSLPTHGTRKHLLASYFAEFIWRKKFNNDFEIFIDHISFLYPTDQFDPNCEQLNFENTEDDSLNEDE
jgi:transposase-like protein